MVGGRVRRRRIEPRPPTMCASVPSLRADGFGFACAARNRTPTPQSRIKSRPRSDTGSRAAQAGMPLLRVRLEPRAPTRAASHRHSLEAATPVTMYTDHQEHPVKRTPPHVLIATIAGAVTVFVVTALVLCPPDRINPILEWFRIITGAVG